MRNTGTIMVSMDSGIFNKAIKPNVQTNDRETQTRGMRIYWTFRKRKKRITAIKKKVIGGSRKKSFSVKLTRAREISGIPT